MELNVTVSLQSQLPPTRTFIQYVRTPSHRHSVWGHARVVQRFLRPDWLICYNNAARGSVQRPAQSLQNLNAVFIWLPLSFNSLTDTTRRHTHTHTHTVKWAGSWWTEPRQSIITCTASNQLYTVLSLTHINLITECCWAQESAPEAKHGWKHTEKPSDKIKMASDGTGI